MESRSIAVIIPYVARVDAAFDSENPLARSGTIIAVRSVEGQRRIPAHDDGRQRTLGCGLPDEVGVGDGCGWCGLRFKCPRANDPVGGNRERRAIKRGTRSRLAAIESVADLCARRGAAEGEAQAGRVKSSGGGEDRILHDFQEPRPLVRRSGCGNRQIGPLAVSIPAVRMK